MYITNRPEIAAVAEKNGVDWIFIDLEIIGKSERQGHLDTVISGHSISDVRKIKEGLTKAKLLVRVNPLYQDTIAEVDRVINDGADIVMLPYFTSKTEVETFIAAVNGRAKTCLLLETPGAVTNIDEILQVPGIDYIHIGLNDLHLGYGMKFMFELLADGTVEMLGNKIKKSGIPFGFGGIARLGGGSLPAERIIAEHYRLGSQMTILSRSFCNTDIITDMEEVEQIFSTGMNEIRELEKSLLTQDKAWFENNRKEVVEAVEQIKNSIK